MICSERKQLILQTILNNICLYNEYCYQCKFESTVYDLFGSIITNTRRCIFNISNAPLHHNCLTKQDNDNVRSIKFTEFMNQCLFKKECNDCKHCYYYLRRVGKVPGCDDVVRVIQNLNNLYKIMVYEKKPQT